MCRIINTEWTTCKTLACRYVCSLSCATQLHGQWEATRTRRSLCARESLRTSFLMDSLKRFRMRSIEWYVSHGLFQPFCPQKGKLTLWHQLQGSLATSKQGKEALMGLVSLALIPFGNLALVGSPSLSLASRQFTRKILTIPHLVEQLPSVLIQSLVASLPHSLLTTTDDFLEVKDAKKILDNLLQLINPTIQKQNVEISVRIDHSCAMKLLFPTQSVSYYYYYF